MFDQRRKVTERFGTIREHLGVKLRLCLQGGAHSGERGCFRLSKEMLFGKRVSTAFAKAVFPPLKFRHFHPSFTSLAISYILTMYSHPAGTRDKPRTVGGKNRYTDQGKAPAALV